MWRRAWWLPAVPELLAQQWSRLRGAAVRGAACSRRGPVRLALVGHALLLLPWLVNQQVLRIVDTSLYGPNQQQLRL